MFNQEDINEWEAWVDKKRFNNYKQEKVLKDPSKERLFKARKNHKWRYPSNGKESKINRKIVQRSFRAKMKNHIKHGRFHTPAAHEYKTYGWETW